MNLRKLVLTFTALAGLAGSAFAQTQTTEATIAKVSGAATVTLPNGTTVPLTAGMKVAQGATITTGADGDVYLESHPGYVTSIKQGSEVQLAEMSVTTEGGKVTEEKTLLDLKSGNLVAKLDPSKKAVNNYQVRTPKGVAAAHGTVFTVQYNGGTYTIAVINGRVSITPPNGGKMTAVSAGMAYREDTKVAGRMSTLAAVLEEQKNTTTGKVTKQYLTNEAGRVEELANEAQLKANDISNIMALAVATVAVAAQNGIGGTTTAEAAQVAQAVFAAVPSAAAASAALISQSTKGQDNSAVVNAITAVVPASEQSAFTQSVQTGTYTQPSTTATPTTPAPPPTVTAPQPIDPSTVSRSG